MGSRQMSWKCTASCDSWFSHPNQLCPRINSHKLQNSHQQRGGERSASLIWGPGGSKTPHLSRLWGKTVGKDRLKASSGETC